jgi:hypothetical protein
MGNQAVLICIVEVPLIQLFAKPTRAQVSESKCALRLQWQARGFGRSHGLLRLELQQAQRSHFGRVPADHKRVARRAQLHTFADPVSILLHFISNDMGDILQSHSPGPARRNLYCTNEDYFLLLLKSLVVQNTLLNTHFS